MAELVAQGRLSEEEAEFHPRRNIMTRALGVDPDVPVDLFLEDARPGDRFLLCSDGLPREVKDDHIASILRRLSDPNEAAKELVDEAKRRGGNDNITVVIIDVVDASQNDPPVDATTVVPVAPVEAPEPSPKPRRSSRRAKRRNDKADSDRPKARIITVRVVAFIVLLLLVIGGAAVAIAWYARSGYFVGLQGQNITIFKGRPGGVLWWKPTVARTTPTLINDIESRHIPDLQAGVEEPSLGAAADYVSSLVNEKKQAESAAAPPASPTATTTVPAQKSVPPTT